MDEQTTQQSATQSEQSTTTSLDATADGAAVSGYSEEPLSAPPADEAPESSQLEQLGAEDMALVDGEIKFGDASKFFGDLGDSDETEQPEDYKNTAKDPSTEKDLQEQKNQQNQQELAERPPVYTDEELATIPFQQWDISRLNGDVARYAQAVQRQIQQMATQTRVQSMQVAPLPPEVGTEPKQYTPKELSDAAKKLACEKLGITEADDFDDYDSEHRAAMELAMQELIQKRSSETANFQRVKSAWTQLQRFNAELAQQPDFNDFNNWCIGGWQKAGISVVQVNNSLYKLAADNGYDFGLVQQAMLGLYQDYQNFKHSKQNASQVQQQPSTQVTPQRQKTRATPPPLLESTRGNNYAGKHTVDLKTFGQMSSDEQAEALIELGLV